jgi:hypothetical protein
LIFLFIPEKKKKEAATLIAQSLKINYIFYFFNQNKFGGQAILKKKNPPTVNRSFIFMTVVTFEVL